LWRYLVDEILYEFPSDPVWAHLGLELHSDSSCLPQLAGD